MKINKILLALVLFLLSAVIGAGIAYWQAGKNVCDNRPGGISKFLEESNRPLPAIEDEPSQFMPEFDQDNYTEIRPPSKPPLLRWDFSKKRKFAYDFYQSSKSKNLMMGQDIGQELEGEGTLLFKSIGDGTATLVLKDVKMVMRMKFPMDVGTKEMESELPPVVVKGVKEDGSIEQRINGLEQFGTMFVLPPNPLQVGESVELPVKIPFNASGSLLDVTGVSKITLEKYVMIEGHKCARLLAQYEVSDLEIPEEIKGSYEVMMKGISVSYFDLKDKCFILGEMVGTASIRAEIPTPRMKMMDEEFPDEMMPETSKMSMDTDGLIRITRNPDKE